MKKLFIVLAVASLGFVACNNESKTETTTDSATAPVVDSMTSPMPDTTMKADTSMKPDSIKK